MQYRFFFPHIGDKYNEGINGKKILVIGASFYCPNRNCTFFKGCTDVTKKDSSHYDKLCPVYTSKGKFLHDEPSYAIEDAPIIYRRFEAFISKFTKTSNYEEIPGRTLHSLTMFSFFSQQKRGLERPWQAIFQLEILYLFIAVR